MSHADNRNSSAAKRARTDGSRREDDWACPSCGNVNYSFRTTCNMRNCTQSRPTEHNMKYSAKTVQPAPDYPIPAAYLNSGTPSSMYLGMPPYSSTMFNGAAMPHYDGPYSGDSAYHYSYGARLSAGSPYRPLHLSGPMPFSGGSMMGNGGMFGMPPLMERGGFGLPPISHVAMGTSMPSFFPDEKSQKGTPRENDWPCPKCGNINFSFRTVCNIRKCNTQKPGSQGGRSDKNSKQNMPEGSWKCESCGNINFPFRTVCNRQNCGAERPSESARSSSPEMHENDQ